MPAWSMAATRPSMVTGRSRDQSDCTPNNGVRGYRKSSSEMIWGCMSMSWAAMCFPVSTAGDSARLVDCGVSLDGRGHEERVALGQHPFHILGRDVRMADTHVVFP